MRSFSRCCVFAVIFLVLGVEGARAQSLDKLHPVSGSDSSSLAAAVRPGGFVVYGTDTGTACRKATPEEAAELSVYRTKEPLHVITEPRKTVAGSHSGMHIILRGTSQLESFPQAKQAFIRAAAIWESIIRNPITVMIDVDFGPTRFGTPWGDGNTLGSTTTDERGGAGTYSEFREALRQTASDATETSLYAALPSGAMPTSIGPTTETVAPSILVRAIGGMPPVAVESDTRPAIGFNSGFGFDLDPSNGIDGDKTDFEGVAVHEIGHALGFASESGNTEMSSELPIAVTLWDFFRFSPGVTTGTFSTSQRSLSSGGAPVFFGGSSQIPVSTGRNDGTGGDGHQSSHWKANEITGTYIGVMDPSADKGERMVITANDLLALDRMGYTVSQISGGGGGGACSEAEPNQTAAEADPITVPGQCTGSAASTDASSISVTYQSGSDGIEDLFKITLSQSQRLVITMNFATASADLDLFLITISGSTITIPQASNGATTTERITTPSALAPGTYYVGVSAFQGSSSYTVNVTSPDPPQPTTPAAPSNLTSTAVSATEVRLNWSDNSSNETGFFIEAKTTGNYLQVAETPANATSVTLGGASAGARYTFRVAAKNASGNSGFSNESSVTTPGGGGATGPCVVNDTTLCLNSNRFKVQVRWATNNGQSGDGHAVGITGDTGYFWFFDRNNVEMVLKVINACPSRYWVFAGGLTNVQVSMTVTDTQNGTVKNYNNPQGTAFQPVQDTNAFATCP